MLRVGSFTQPSARRRPLTFTPAPRPALQRKCACGQHGPAACAACATAAPAQGDAEAPPSVGPVLRSSGEPLAAATRTFFEARFGHDFSRVRVHTDQAAAASARDVDAAAYTVGAHIVFDRGRYAPQSAAGRHLLAHELSHVVQQGGARAPTSPAAPRLERSAADPALEAQADATAAQVLAAAPGAAPVRRLGPTAGTPRLQRRMNVLDPATRATYLPRPDNTRPRAELVERWLRQLCPAGTWNVDRSSGLVDAGNRASVCGTAPAAAGGTPVSCDCLCTATAAGSDQINIKVAERFPIDYFRYDPNLQIFTLRSDPGVVSASGEGFTVFPEEGAWLDDKTIVLSGRSTTVAGAGDTSRRRGARVVRDPPWIILGHELCGHIGVRAAGGTDLMHVETPSGRRSAVDIENRIRREHSTITSSFGIRSGDTGGLRGGLYRIGAGETYASISRRVGIRTGRGAFDADGYHRRILHWPSGDRIQRSDITSLFTPGAEIFIEGIHWHEVISGETWRRIAAMWRVPAASLRRANPGVRLSAGVRILIPVR